MDGSTEVPDAPKRPHRRWVKHAALSLAALVVAAAIAVPWTLVASHSWPHRPAPTEPFRFEQVYLRTHNETGMVPIDIDLWFSVPGNRGLHDVRLVAVAVENGRNFALERSELVLGDLDGHKTFEKTVTLTLDAAKSVRIEVLVLVDGFLVARGEGGVGPRLLYAADGQALSQPARLEGDQFQYDYYTQ